MSIKMICQNKKAFHEYSVLEKYEAGMVLTGSEVKSLRENKANLTDGYARIVDHEVFLFNVHISPYSHTHHEQPSPTRTRRLLMNRREIKRLTGKVEEKGLALIPTKMYFKDGWAKLELALAKGKKTYDKRESLKKKDQEREISRRYREER